MTILGSGRVGINNSNPDEELVIGTNLGAGWVIPVITAGSNSGGALEVGTPTINFSVSAGTAFNRTRLIASDANGFGQGLIEMRTRQLNIGVEPGVNTTSPYMLRIVENGVYGFDLVSNNGNDDWEHYVNSSGEMFLFHNNQSRGFFDPASGNYSATSDARLKTNIRSLTGILPKLLALNAKKYEYKSHPGKEYHGFLAQDIQQLFPEIVTEAEARNNGEQPTLLVDYAQLTVLAIEAVKEQQQTIDAQKAEIEALKKQHQADMEAIYKRLEALENK